jgi:hypothetical protein
MAGAYGFPSPSRLPPQVASREGARQLREGHCRAPGPSRGLGQPGLGYNEAALAGFLRSIRSMEGARSHKPRFLFCSHA